MKSNEKQSTRQSAQKENQNLKTSGSEYYRPTSNFGQRLDEIEADAQALKRSMLDTSQNRSSSRYEPAKELS